MTKSMFNVLCVTLDLEGNTQWHRPIAGIAELVVQNKGKFGIEVPVTYLRFNEEIYQVLELDGGLNGSAVAFIVMTRKGEKLKLYTDTPTGKYPQEQIREIAKREIAKHQ